ncbi:DUF6493 family protein [Catellatospora sp. KI3]|uniref:DUF7824 domain-containing protein n=1 Tax=Catellatospora sp. KI3 TaxID=3041620 RepID=UPI0024821C86|nr:DUF6493 family protein [Catellatospora sp. KI3]MDI1463371.1 DUF6493 family protein [Catellatospora sp. KI3]
MTAPLPAELATALNKRDVQRVHAHLMAASERDRKAAFAAVGAYLREESGAWMDGHLAAAGGLALLGCAPTAKKAMSALNRGTLSWQRRHLPAQETAELLVARGVPWLGELARLWAQTEGPSAAEWLIVDALARAAGLPTPQTEGFTRGWISWIRAQDDPYAALTRGDYTQRLLPQLFATDDMGAILEFTYSGTGFNASMIRLAAEDPAIRAMLLDGCLARLLRGGRPGQLSAYVTLHDQLSPTPEEVAGRVADYLPLLSAHLGTAAATAQRSLRGADEAGLLDVETLIGLAPVVLSRTEKGLLKTQATWLRQAAKRHPGRAAELLALLEGPAEADALVPVPPPAAVIPEIAAPIASLTELAEELASMLSGDPSIAARERVLAGLVEWHRRGRAELAAAIGPVVRAHEGSLDNQWVAGPRLLLAKVLYGLIDTVPVRLNDVVGLPDDLAVAHLLHRTGQSPDTVTELRLLDIERQLTRRPVPFLLATPTQVNGHLDPAVLLDRLERAERDGWQPWSGDLAQALLRIPRTEIEPAIARRADRLTSPAGLAFARGLRDGHTDPVITRVEQHGHKGKYPWLADLPDRRMAVAMTPPPGTDPVQTAIFTLPSHDQPLFLPWMSSPGMWAGALPSHRDVVAGWVLARLAMSADSSGGAHGAAAVLPLLAEAHGPTGAATSLALVYGMTAPQAADRVATVDAIIGFGAGVNWLEVGDDLGDCVSAGSIKLNRAAETLRSAAEAGAVDAVWQICAEALPHLLTAPKPRRGVADILRLATRCARAIGRRGRIAGLAEVAARGGGSGYITAARELHDVLA